MIRFTAAFATMTFLLLGGMVLAAEPCAKPLGRELRCTRCMALSCRCPDDYCRKPMPCIPCGPQKPCVDDYCRKPMPCVPCPSTSGCPDNYCRKPMPNLCWAVDHRYYRCPPPACRDAKSRPKGN